MIEYIEVTENNATRAIERVLALAHTASDRTNGHHYTVNGRVHPGDKPELPTWHVELVATGDLAEHHQHLADYLRARRLHRSPISPADLRRAQALRALLERRRDPAGLPARR